MSISALAAGRAWVNGRKDLAAEGGPLPNGCHYQRLRSPAGGAYAVVSSNSATGVNSLVAEDPAAVISRRLVFDCYSPGEEVAEKAGTALAAAIAGLRGAPEACGPSGVLVLAHDNLAGPALVEQPPDSGEEFCFQVSADFIFREQ